MVLISSAVTLIIVLNLSAVKWKFTVYNKSTKGGSFMNFGERLNECRKDRGFTAQKMADMLGVGIRSYRAYESGDREPGFSTLVKMADILEVPTDFLLGRDGFLQSLGVSVDEYP